MNCLECQASIADGSKFCSECGAPTLRRCGGCGQANHARAKFCSECGKPFGGEAARPVSAPPSHPPGRAAEERRQLTVMFVDLVASAELSARHDPEDLRQMIVSFQQAAEVEIQVYEGHIAQYLGDGILVYFGYPRAHENEGQRAVLAALGILEAVRKLNTAVQARFGVALAVRIGIHTGSTVIGEVGSQGTRETLAIGPTPNIAARLQAIAAPNSIVISEETRELVRDAFLMEDLGLQQLKGFVEPRRGWKVARPAASTRFQEAILAFDRHPMFGRDAELKQLLSRWGSARAGAGGIAFIRGDAGSGKSRLISALVTQLTAESCTLLACRCSPFHSNSPLHALREMFASNLGAEPELSSAEQRAALEAGLSAANIHDPSALSLMAALLGLGSPEGAAAALTPQIKLQRTLNLLWQLLAKACEKRPVVVLVEDLHWVDASTLEFLRDLSANIATRSLLVVLTSRTSMDLGPSETGRDIVLAPLPRAEVKKIVEHLRSGSSLVEKIVDLADGNPFFAEELTRMTLASSAAELMAASKSSDSSIPSTLRDLLTARLDRLPPARRTLVQLSSVLGRTFSAELLAEIVEAAQPELGGELGLLADAEVIGAYGPPGRKTLVFKHALLQEAAYQALPLRTRVEYHTVAAQVLERSDAEPEVLAHHFTAAGQSDKAILYWHRAGEAALKAFGLADAVGHLSRGLSLAAQLPESPERLQAEIGLRLTLGAPIMLLKGFASPEARAHNEALAALCRRVGKDAPAELQFAPLCSLWTFYEVSAAYANAEEIGDRLLQLAQSAGQSTIMLAARTTLGAAHLMRGRFSLARSHFEEALRLYEPREHRRLAEVFGQDCAAMCASFLTWVHVHEGNLEAAQRCAAETRRLCADCNQHPGTRGFAECVLATSYNLLGEYQQAASCSRAVIELSVSQGMPHWAAQGEINLGWSLLGQGAFQEAQEKIARGIAALLALGSRASMTYFYGALASAELGLGRFDEALRVLDRAAAQVEESDERNHEVELHRLRARVLLAQEKAGAREQARALLERALKLATHQGVRYFAVRVTEDLAALAVVARDRPGDLDQVTTS